MKTHKNTTTTPGKGVGGGGGGPGNGFARGPDARLKGVLLRAHRGRGLTARQRKLVALLEWERFITAGPATNGKPRNAGSASSPRKVTADDVKRAIGHDE